MIPNPVVSVLVVCRNEALYIDNCLHSILHQDFNLSQLELIVVDGVSEDKTVEIINRILKSSAIKWQLLHNPGKTLSSGWNIGIKASSGEYIIRIDAHASIPANFISQNVLFLNQNPNADVVGGRLTVEGNGFAGSLIAVTQNSLFGVGNSPFRTATQTQKADTAVYGMYRKKVFETVGLFNESLARNQDIEFHKRVVKAGFTIMF
jgi:glycosyltransferase involved in cell wall biosynthesis